MRNCVVMCNTCIYLVRVQGFNLSVVQLLFSATENIILYHLTLSLLMTTKDAFVDSVDKDQTAHNMQFELRST